MIITSQQRSSIITVRTHNHCVSFYRLKCGRFSLSKSVLTNDLSKERPEWILSAYGPGKDIPKQLFGGPLREQSFEELRVRHYELAAQGRQQQAEQEALELVRNAESQMQNALSDVDGAIQYILDGENERPNRIDVCKARGTAPLPNAPTASVPQSTMPFGRPSSTTPAFGQPAIPSSFSRLPAPAFGQPSRQPATLGRPSAPTSTFGQPSAPTSTFGQASGPTFGQSSAPSSTFGQPSSLNLGQPSFGQTSTLNRPTTSFGQPSTNLEQSSNPKPPFGQPPSASPFGNPQSNSTSASVNPFQQASSQPSGFGKPSSQQQTGAFGKPSTTNTQGLAGQSAPQQTTGFSTQNQGAPRNPFASPLSPVNQNHNRDASPNPFGQPSLGNQDRAFGQNSSVSGPRATVVNGAESSIAQIQKDSQGRVKVWNGKSVSYENDEPCYRGNDGSWRRIWFPDGVPSFVNSGGLPDTAYDGLTRESYDFLRAHGTFKNGVMPLVPPKREWCEWNL